MKNLREIETNNLSTKNSNGLNSLKADPKYLAGSGPSNGSAVAYQPANQYGQKGVKYNRNVIGINNS